jgi:hypothetical protein
MFPNPATHQVRYVVTALSEANPFAERNLHLEPAQTFSVRNRLNFVEVKNSLAEMYAAGNDLGGTRSAALACQPSLSHPGEPLGKIRQDFGGYLAVPAPGTQNARKGNRGKRFWEHLLENLKRQALLEFHPSRPEDGADGFCRSALSSDHFAEIGWVNSKFQNCNLFTLHSANLHLFRVIHERLRDGFNQFLHGPSAIRRISSQQEFSLASVSSHCVKDPLPEPSES